GANGLESHIPKGVPGAILSGGLILPLDIAVGLVVACTMFGFYSLFRRGTIAEDGAAGTVNGGITETFAGDTATGTVSGDSAAENVSGDAIADNTADKEES
ncbi:MAG: hypothetical protein IJR48_03170, partial [Oscillibacter sp.]|nr:hypothetical protein [Oscillibacter sp.]